MTTDGNEDLPEHVALNRAKWDEWAAEYAAPGERAWALAPGEETWGIFDVPEAEIHLLPDDLEGLDAIELGCGTGYISAWMARRGARVVGIDNSPKQLETATRLQREHGLDFPLLLGNAEKVPYPDASFDFAISEYGAALWADPYAWVPEAARLLRPGGRPHHADQRPARLPHDAGHRGGRAGRRAPQAPAVRDAPDGLARRAGRRGVPPRAR